MAGVHYKTVYQITNDTIMDAFLGMTEDEGSTQGPGLSNDTQADSGVHRFATEYMKVHGYLSVFVCVFGIVSNMMNIVVLTRKHMESPTNYILTALATADMLTMTTYPIMAVYLYIINTPDCIVSKHKKGWMYFVLFHNLFIVTCHNMATWCTIVLGIFRYIFVCQHHLASRFCSMERARITTVLVVVGTLMVCLPNYFMYRVGDFGAENNGTSCYFILPSQYAQNNPAYQQFVWWLYGVVIKIIPCIVLTILSVRIIVAMQTAKKRRARLLHNVSRVLDHDHQMNEHNRTTIMLICVLTIFIITELPQVSQMCAMASIDVRGRTVLIEKGNE